MAIDIFLVHGPVFGPLLAGVAILAFVLLAQRFARAGDAVFFYPSVLLGTVGFAIVFGGLQLLALSQSGVTPRPAMILWTMGSFAAPGLAGSWLSSRSLLKSMRHGQGGGARVALRAVGAFWVGLLGTTLVAAVAVVLLGQR